MKTDAGPERAFYLPDFCTSRVTLAIVLIVELTAFVLTLAAASAVDFWTALVRSSLFLLWTGLACAALLCVGVVPGIFYAILVSAHASAALDGKGQHPSTR